MNTRLNILLFLTDDHAAWAAGCYGNREVHTRNIDFLASEGIQMLNAYTPTPVCSPARASLFTGKTSSQHGIHDYIGTAGNMDDNYCWLQYETILPELLQAGGYETAVVGKWHLGQEKSAKKGFDHSVTIGPEYPVFHDQPRIFYDGSEPIEKTGYLAGNITDEARSYLRKRDREKPFFLTIGHYATHSPWKGHPERIVAEYRSSGAGKREGANHYPFGIQRNESLDPTRQNPEEALCQYYAGVSEIDESVGCMLDELTAQGILDNTLIIYTSDHGLNCGQHGLWGKGNATFPLNMVEESIRIPLILYNRKLLFSRQKRSEPVNHTDTFATILEAAGVVEDADARKKRNSPGQSYYPMLANTSRLRDWRTVQICEYGPVRTAVDKNYKLSMYPEGQADLLFDLRNDPGEEHNLYDAPGYRKVRNRLATAIDLFFETYSEADKEGDNIGSLPRYNPLAAWEEK